MYLAKYLLSIADFMDTEEGEALVERAFLRVDETRRRKAEGLRPERARAASLGAGLLLQLAAGEACAFGGDAGGRENGRAEDAALQKCGLRRYSVAQLLAYMEKKPLLPLAYEYGKKGKPYFKDLPFSFSLSHSGDYVLCGLSAEEIGADIQQHGGKDVRKLSQRFFSGREAAAIERAGEAGEKLFYRLWARKEAYGKLTGKGIAEVLKVDLLPEDGRPLPEEEEAEGGSCGPSREAVLRVGRAVPSREAVLRVGRAVPSQKAVLRVGRAVPSREASLRVGKAVPPRGTVLPDGRRLLWEECCVEGYSIAFCRYG